MCQLPSLLPLSPNFSFLIINIKKKFEVTFNVPYFIVFQLYIVCTYKLFFIHLFSLCHWDPYKIISTKFVSCLSNRKTHYIIKTLRFYGLRYVYLVSHQCIQCFSKYIILIMMYKTILEIFNKNCGNMRKNF